MRRRVDIPAVVPAAGLGTRMRKLCGERPKELLPVRGLAAIEHSMVEALDAGLSRVAVVVRPDKPLIEEYISGHRPATLGEWSYAGPPIDYRQRFEEILFVVQPEADGVADAIVRARSALRAEAIACLMPDNVAFAPRPSIAACLDSYHATGLTTCAVVTVRSKEAYRFANCGGLEVWRRTDGRLAVATLQDKGSGSFKVGPEGEALRAIGRSVLAPRFFELLDEQGRPTADGEVDDVPLYQALAAAGEFLVAPIEGECFDLGLPEGYEAALSYSADHPALGRAPFQT